ncbi:MAG TPA: adenylate/guanylate cyclase domain-containing protein, partial [Micromonosporaceae bacterium]
RRAAAAWGARRPTGSEPEHLDRIAERLGGLPLALELAAARLAVLSPAELAARLDDPLTALGGALALGEGGSGAPDARPLPSREPGSRHASLGAALDWSYRTLAADPARLLRWLSVFAGPVDLGAIEWLVGSDPLDALAVLVDKSLVQPETTGDRSTYRLLGPVRAYAAAHLVARGEQSAARDRHVAWCLRAVRAATGEADGRPAAPSGYPLDPLAEEVRAALRWSATEGSGRRGLRLVTALDLWWRERGLVGEARTWLYRLGERITVTGEDVPPGEAGIGYLAHARYAALEGDYDAAARFWRRAEAWARRSGDPALRARVLAERGALLLGAGGAGAQRIGRADSTGHRVSARRGEHPGHVGRPTRGARRPG